MSKELYDKLDMSQQMLKQVQNAIYGNFSSGICDFMLSVLDESVGYDAKNKYKAKQVKLPDETIRERLREKFASNDMYIGFPIEVLTYVANYELWSSQLGINDGHELNYYSAIHDKIVGVGKMIRLQ